MNRGVSHEKLQRAAQEFFDEVVSIASSLNCRN